MKTRVLLMILLSAIVVSLSSCTRTEKRIVPGMETWDIPDYYVIQNVDGKRLWGLEGCLNHPNKGMIIPVLYDSIAPSDVTNPSTMERLGKYKALKNGLWYAYSGSRKLEAPGFTHYENIKKISPLGGLEWKLYTPDGVYGMYSEFESAYGPYDEVYPGAAGHFFKKNGKWGYLAHEYKTGKSSDFLPAEYEAIIEISSGSHLNYDKNYFLIKKDGKWSFFNLGKTYPQPSWYTALLFDGMEYPLKISLNNLLNWYGRFPSGEMSSMTISYKGVRCTKHSSGEVGVMWDI